MFAAANEQERQILVEGRKVARAVRLMDICIDKFCSCADVTRGSGRQIAAGIHRERTLRSWFYEFEQNKDLLQSCYLTNATRF